MLQALIFILGTASLYSLTSGKTRIGSILGLASQPLFLYSTVSAGQTGLTALAVIYSIIYIKGILK